MERKGQYTRWVEGVLILDLISTVMAKTYRIYKNIPILPILGIRRINCGSNTIMESLSCLVFDLIFKILLIYLNKYL